MVFSVVRVDRHLLFCVLFCKSLFVFLSFFCLPLSVFLRLMASGYSCGIFKPIVINTNRSLCVLYIDVMLIVI
jgi:hypothetical protein